jgi:uncharacterized membrane protein
MRYMFKDLMVTVLAEEAEAGPHCGSCSVISCDLPTVHCGGLTCPLTSVIHMARIAESLDLVKQELEHALGQIAEAEKAGEAEARPSSVAEAQYVEEQLKGALEELQQRKDSLSG